MHVRGQVGIIVLEPLKKPYCILGRAHELPLYETLENAPGAARSVRPLGLLGSEAVRRT